MPMSIFVIPLAINKWKAKPNFYVSAIFIVSIPDFFLVGWGGPGFFQYFGRIDIEGQKLGDRCTINFELMSDKVVNSKWGKLTSVSFFMVTQIFMKQN